jgi:gliding motility-associated-like protein
VIYLQNTAGNVVELDTVWGVNNNSYTYSEITNLNALTYSVAAFDSCFTTSIPATYQTSAKADVHSTVYLSGYFDPCGSLGIIDWTPYFGWDNVDHYEVYIKDPTGVWTNTISTNNLQLSHVFTASGFHDIVVIAHHIDGRQSTSNKLSLNVYSKPAPNINYILSASVIDKQVTIRHLTDTSGNVSAVAFERRRKDGTFYEIGREAVFQPITYFVDEDVDVEEVNSYRTVIIDSCGIKTTISDTAQTTVLSIVGDSINYINTISWTPYVGYDGNVQRYDLFRLIDGIISPSAIASVGANTLTFADNVDLEFVRNRLCYFVVAIENTNSYGFAEQANSNVKCSEFTPTVFIPNAFTPDGFNPVFRPKYTYMKLPQFEMRIFNRWGEIVYESEDPLDGWNGKIAGSTTEAPDGAYIYHIRFYGIDDKQMVFAGHVNLLR